MTAAIAYARMSQDRTGLATKVDGQLELIAALAEANGDTIEVVFTDNDESASSKTRRGKARPGYTDMTRYIADGGEGGKRVYVWHADRLYREPRDLEDLCDLVEDHGLAIITVKAGTIDLATPSGRMVARMLGAAAKHEVELKAERQLVATNRTAKAGGVNGGGKRALGYERDGVTIRPVEAAALRDAARAITSGASIASAARALSEAVGYRVPPVSLRRSLLSARVIGMREHLPEAARRKGTKAGTLTEAAWPAILDADTARTVRAILEDPARRATRPARRRLLSGILHCARCGRRMQGSGDAYKCSMNGGCFGTSIKVTIADAHVADWVRTVVDTERAELAARHQAMADADAAHAAGMVDLDALESELAQVAELRGAGRITLTEYLAIRDGIAARIDAAKAADRQLVARTNARRIVREAAESWDALGWEQQRAAIQTLLVQNGARLDVHRVRPGITQRIELVAA